MGVEDLLTVSQISEINPVLSEATLRWWIFNSEQLGFDACLIRIGGRIYIDKVAFEEWLDQNRVKVLSVPAE